MVDMDKIRKGLFLGGITATADAKLLLENGISHILTLNSEPVLLRKEDGFTAKHIHCFDMPEQDLLTYFDECFQFIDDALSQQNKGLLIHWFDCIISTLLFMLQQLCSMSRSATVVIAYLMYKEKLSLEDAMSSVKKHRPDIRPNEGFHEQLIMFERMGNVINDDHDLYRRYRLQLMALKVQSGDTEAVSRLKQVPKTPGEISDSYYRCAKCRKVLFKKSSILPHPVGRGEEAFGWQRKVSTYNLASSLVHDLDTGEKCERSLFVEPVQWMSKVIKDIEGKLTCPYCNVKLGSFVWYGEKCPCGTWVAPSFHVQTNKVDLVKPRPEIAISRPGVSQSAGTHTLLQHMDSS